MNVSLQGKLQQSGFSGQSIQNNPPRVALQAQPDVYFSSNQPSSGPKKLALSLMAAVAIGVGAIAITGGNVLEPIRNLITQNEGLSREQQLEAKIMSKLLQTVDLQVELAGHIQKTLQTNPENYNVDIAVYNDGYDVLLQAQQAVKDAGITPETMLTMKPNQAQKDVFSNYGRTTEGLLGLIPQEDAENILNNTPYFEETFMPQAEQLQQEFFTLIMTSDTVLDESYQPMWE